MGLQGAEEAQERPEEPHVQSVAYVVHPKGWWAAPGEHQIDGAHLRFPERVYEKLRSQHQGGLPDGANHRIPEVNEPPRNHEVVDNPLKWLSSCCMVPVQQQTKSGRSAS